LLINQLIQSTRILVPIRGTDHYKRANRIVEKCRLFPPTGGNPTSMCASVGVATTKSGSTPTGGTGATAKSGSLATGGTGSGSGNGSGGSSGGTVAPAATTTAPGGSTGVAARNSRSLVAVVLLGLLVGLLGSR